MYTGDRAGCVLREIGQTWRLWHLYPSRLILEVSQLGCLTCPRAKFKDAEWIVRGTISGRVNYGVPGIRSSAGLKCAVQVGCLWLHLNAVPPLELCLWPWNCVFGRGTVSLDVDLCLWTWNCVLGHGGFRPTPLDIRSCFVFTLTSLRIAVTVQKRDARLRMEGFR